jgi:hypothetical protein
MIDLDPFAERTTLHDAIGTLIRCECGHGIGAHTRDGCRAGVYPGCRCRFTDGAALDRAIARAAQPAFVNTAAVPPPGGVR